MIRFARAAGLAAIAIASIVAAPASAVVTTFASFSPIGSGANVRFVNAASNTNAVFYSTATANATVAGARNVNFSLLQSSINPFVNNVTAKFSLSGIVTNTAATVAGTTITQSNISGSFSFLSTAAITIGSTTFAAGSNLLSGTFTNGAILGTRNTTGGSFSGSTPSSAINYSSDFLTFVPNSSYDFSMSLTSISPALNALLTNAAPTRALRTFRAVVGGSFSSDPAPTVAVPEPAIWLQLIAGFGLVGVAARRRKVAIAG
jgi:hypothetical protein